MVISLAPRTQKGAIPLASTILNMFTIYKVTNEITNDFYIGFTTSLNPEKRFERHKSNTLAGISFHLYSAMRKYGIENFTFSALEVGENVEYGHKIAESLYIKWLRPKYNMTSGGDGVIGYVYTEEARKKISESLRGRKFPNRKRSMGTSHSLESKKKISESVKRARKERFWSTKKKDL